MIEGAERWEYRLQTSLLAGIHVEIWAWFLHVETAIDCADELNWRVRGQECFEKFSQKKNRSDQ